jgi:hypothetical protein
LETLAHQRFYSHPPQVPDIGKEEEGQGTGIDRIAETNET